MSELAGYIYSVEIGHGFAVIEGWLVSTRDGSTPDDIFLVLDDATPVLIRKKRIHRELQQVGISRGAAAFRMDVDLPAAAPADKVDVALLVPSLGQRVNFSDVDVRLFVPRGGLEVDAQGISGWLYDPATWRGGPPAQLQIGSIASISVEPNTIREDVCEMLKLPTHPLGFRVPIAQLQAMLSNNERAAADAKVPLRLVSSGILLAEEVFYRSFSPIHAPDGTTRTLLRTRTSIQGNIDGYREGQIFGWAIDPDAPEQPVELSIDVDGTRYAVVRADRPRTDLATKGLSQRCGGFSLPITQSPTGQSDIEVRIRCDSGGELIGKKPFRIRGLPVVRQPQDWARAVSDLSEKSRPLLLIMPVYNAPDEVAACLESIIEHSTLPCRLLIIDDASTDPRVAEALSHVDEISGIEIIRNETNLGFVATCNRGFSLAAGHDVVLINSDIVVGPRWLENLQLAAYSRPNVGTVTPLSSNAGVFSAPEPNQVNPVPAGWRVADHARLVLAAATDGFPIVPTGNGFCMFIRGECLETVGEFDVAAFPRGYGEENDFCMRAARAGFVHLMDHRTFVHHERSASFKAEKTSIYDAGQAILRERYPDYKQLTRRFFVSPPIQTVRWRLRQAIARQRERPRPRILFVIATETGGTPLTNADLMTALSDRYEPWLLRSNGRRITLSRYMPGSGAPALVESHELFEPIEIADHRSQEYVRVVAGMLVRSGVELVHIRHLAWHSLDLPALCKSLSLPVVLSFHDFYAVCPTVKLIDSECNACCLAGHMTSVPCHAELWDRDRVPPLKSGFLERWREMMAEALAPVDSFVTTSPEARARLTAIYPQLASNEFHIIPHGRDFSTMSPPVDRRSAGRPFRILVPGNISPAKGARLIQAIAALDGGRELEFHVLGRSGNLQAGPGLILHGAYDRNFFQEKVAEIKPVIGVVFSRWPETYCHTLTEMWACGLPVLATEFGAVAERIARHGGGWLHPAKDSPETVRDRLLALLIDEAGFRDRLTEITAWQEGYGRDYGCAMMAAFYDRIYREQFQHHRAFYGWDDEHDLLIWAHLGRGARDMLPNVLTSHDILVPFQGIPDTTQPEFAALAGFAWSIASEDEANDYAESVLAALGERKLVLDLRAWTSEHTKRLPAELLGRANLVLF